VARRREDSGSVDALGNRKHLIVRVVNPGLWPGGLSLVKAPEGFEVGIKHLPRAVSRTNQNREAV
jgi:hypothetical protein